jgi:cytochrome b involved in lipid metabolism
MKNLSTISLFIFGVILTAILTAGLVFYQDSKGNGSNFTKNNNLREEAVLKNGIEIKNNQNKNIKTEISNIKSDIVPSVTTIKKTLTLSLSEVNKHNSEGDCWMIIDNKVYNITSYFGKHPGGSRTMIPTCGTDATVAYNTQDPYANSSQSRSAHSTRARNLLADYYLGDLNQVISE